MSLTDREIINLEKEIHVWCCTPETITDSARLEKYLAMLSAEELDRYHSFHFAKDQHSYLLSHALVRTVLSSYCDVLPQQWQFDINDHGKPEIASTIDCPALRFNLSHTDGLAMCVVTLEDDCGIDVENRRRQNRLLPVAEKMFAEHEVLSLRELGEDEMRMRFFDYWTLREAFVKAVGTGLSGSSKQFYFELLEDSEEHCGEKRGAQIRFDQASDEHVGARIGELVNQTLQHSAWQFALLAPTTEHTAALACAMSSAGQNKVIISRQIIP